MHTSRLLHSLIIAVCLWVIFPLPGASYASEERRNKVKAVFLYKFFDYVTWPETKAERKLCILGTAPFMDILFYIQKKQKTPVEIQNITSEAEAKKCDLVFFAGKARTSDALATPGVLTVSDTTGFAENGGMIELIDREEEIDLKINLNTVRDSGLKVSSRLLGIAEVLR